VAGGPVASGSTRHTQSLTLADAIFPRIDSRNRLLAWARDLALMAGFAAFIALFAQIQLRQPAAWTPVPITGQTLAVLVSGGALGAWRGTGSTSLYAVAGMIGIPVYTPAAGVTHGAWDVHVIVPWKGNEGYVWDLASVGYIVGFILAAALVGFLAERRWDRGPWVHLIMLLGSVLVYVPGLYWLGHKLHFSFSTTLEKGLYPFIVGDLMKLLLAAMVLPGAWALVEKLERHRPVERNDLPS
jgi:biotin transport system substrate-specific component